MGEFACRICGDDVPVAMAENRAPPATSQTVQARVVESRSRTVPVNIRSTGTVHCA